METNFICHHQNPEAYQQYLSMRHTLWTLLNEKTVEIPIFQRDYAQGRPEKAILRRDFLKQLIGSLSHTVCNPHQGSLDFVYSFGETPREANPLDGQQRLTTLWLLHWYVAIHALKDDKLTGAFNILSKFRYRTRHSSSDFIDSLCKTEHVKSLVGAGNISEAIKDSTWFVKSWLHDPTVTGLLTTLAGTNHTEKVDANGIQPILEMEKHNFMQIWEKLTSPECPIYFDHLNIENIEVRTPDILYIKMNARGKALNPYEKFKAQWIKSITTQQSKDEAFEISRLIDTDWSEIFWDKKLKTKGIDQRKMAFYTRFYLCRLFDALNDSVNNKDHAGKQLRASTVYAKENKEGYDFEFNGLDDFKIANLPIAKDNTQISYSLLGSSSLSLLKRLFERTNILFTPESISGFIPHYSSHFSFLPVLRDDDKKDAEGHFYVRSLSMNEQVMFYSMVCYLTNSENPNEQSLKRWMRVCCNIAENTNHNSETSTHLTIIEKIREFALHDCDDIHSTLVAKIHSDYMPKSTLEQVLLEERHKAAQILEDNSFEQQIIEAENFAFFNGAIRFLFLNSKGEVDWSTFNQKFNTARQLFCREGLTEEAKNKDEAARKLISHCRNWSHQIEKEIYLFSHSATKWREILLDPAYTEPLHQLLLTNSFAPSPISLNDTDPYRQNSHYILIKGGYLSSINTAYRDRYFIRWYDSGMCLYLRSRKGDTYFLASDRLTAITALTEQFANSTEIKVSPPQNGQLYSRAENFFIEYRGYESRLQHWGYTDMYDNNQRLQDIEALAGRCSFETSLIDPSKGQSEADIKKVLDECIDNYEKWRNSIQTKDGNLYPNHAL